MSLDPDHLHQKLSNLFHNQLVQQEIAKMWIFVMYTRNSRAFMLTVLVAIVAINPALPRCINLSTIVFGCNFFPLPAICQEHCKHSSSCIYKKRK